MFIYTEISSIEETFNIRRDSTHINEFYSTIH